MLETLKTMFVAGQTVALTVIVLAVLIVASSWIFLLAGMIHRMRAGSHSAGDGGQIIERIPLQELEVVNTWTRDGIHYHPD